MNTYEVKGMLKVDYVNAQDKRIVGTRLNLVFDDSKWQGEAAEIVYVPGDKANHVKVGDFVRLLYNRYGKIDEVVVEG